MTTPNYPQQYLNAIKSGEIVACNKIKKLYEREVNWMTKQPKDFSFYFDPEAGLRPINFIESFCKHSKGKLGGQLIKLELFQKAAIQLLFGWLQKDIGLRRFREIVLIIPRKNGKSTLAATLALYMLIADSEKGAEIYCCANKLDQAKIVFNECVNMRQQSEAISSITKKRQNDIYFPATFSFLKAIASDTKTLDGLNAHMFVQDEFSVAKDSSIYDLMIQSQTAREQPLALLISTNNFLREAFFDDKYNYCSHVALWEQGFEDYRLLPLIYELDNPDTQWDKPKFYEAANPGIGSIKALSALQDNVDKAKRDPSFKPTVLVKDFNAFENTNKAWLPYNACVNDKVVPIEFLQNSYACGGVDLSATTDLTCATLLIKKPNDDNIYVLQKYFLPEKRINDLEANPNKKEAPYKLWAEQGWLHICDGAAVDYKDVTRWFVYMVNINEIRPLWVFYDAALSGYFAPQMTEYGFEMVKIRQGAFTFTYPMKQMGAALEEHKVIYQNNPMLRWCLLNTGVKTLNKDGINSISPVKTGTNKRIDGMVSLLNAWVGYSNHYDEYMSYVK